MDPITLATIAVTTAAVGTGLSAYSSHEQGVAARKQAEYQAAVARNNQVIADQYATYEVQKGQRLEEAKRMETAQREGAVRAAVGASGLDVDSGSPLRLQADTAMLGELDALTIRSNAQRAAHGFKTQGMNYAAQASLDDMAAQNASNFGQLGMWSSIIGGASSVSSKWSSFQQAGIRPFGG